MEPIAPIVPTDGTRVGRHPRLVPERRVEEADENTDECDDHEDQHHNDRVDLLLGHHVPAEDDEGHRQQVRIDAIERVLELTATRQLKVRGARDGNPGGTDSTDNHGADHNDGIAKRLGLGADKCLDCLTAELIALVVGELHAKEHDEVPRDDIENRAERRTARGKAESDTEQDRYQRTDGDERLHRDAVHRHIGLHERDHAGAAHGDGERREERADDVANSRQDVVDRIELVEVALLEPLPAHALPDQVDGSGAVEQNGAERTDGCAEGSCHAGCLGRTWVDALALDGKNGQRDADVRHGTNISGNGSARGDQGDVNDLDGSTDGIPDWISPMMMPTIRPATSGRPRV